MTLDDDPRVACPSCLAANRLREHFCQRCGTPLSNLAVTDPIERASAEADTFRKAMDYATRPIVLIGVWLIWGPVFFSCLVIFVGSIAGFFTSPFGPVTAGTILAIFLLLLMLIGLSAISGTILWRTTRTYRQSPPIER